MSTDDRFTADLPPLRPGMSTGAKLLLGTGIGCGVLCLLCCGGTVAVIWLGADMLKSGLIREPAEVRTMTAELATLDIPAGLEPQAAIDVQVPLLRMPLFKGVFYTDKEHDDQVLALVEFSGNIGPVDEKRLRREIDNAVARGNRDGDDDFRVRESHDLELEIRGKPAKFRIEQGEDGKDRKVVRAFGEFPGRGGVTMLFLQLDAEQFTPEQVEEILRSIR